MRRYLLLRDAHSGPPVPSPETEYVADDDPRLSDARSPLAHGHSIGDTTGLQAALDGKQASGSYAAAVHAHAQADVTGLVTDLAAKAPLASPAFTGTPTGITKSHVGLGSADNTADSAKPISTATQTALDLKAPIASPTFTGTVGGVTKAMVGLGSVDNTTDAGKPVSTATQTALDGKSATGHNHDAAYDAIGAAAAAQSASQPVDSDLTAIAALATTSYGRALLTLVDAAALTALSNAFTSALKGLVPASGGGTANFLRADGTFAAPTASLAGATVEKDLGSTATWRGKFTITDAGIGPTSKVLCWQSPGPYTGKGTLADEAEMQPVSVIAVEPGSGSAVVRWQTPPGFTQQVELPSGSRASPAALNEQMMFPTLTPRRVGKVRGNVKFTYTVLA